LSSAQNGNAWKLLQESVKSGNGGAFNGRHNQSLTLIFPDVKQRMGEKMDLDDNGVLLEIGNEYAPANDLTSFNLIEDCHLYHSGHHVVGLMGSNNVLRNNYIHNENWWDDPDHNCKWGNRIVYMQSNDSGEGVMSNRRNLVEGNRIAFGGETAETINPTDYQVGGGGISKFSMPYNIVRKNMLYYTLTSGMFFQTFHHGNVVYNHVYHNVFFRNGYSDNPKIGNSGGHAIFFNFNQGPEPVCTYEQYGNCIKNNIFHDNRNRSNKTEPIIGACYAGAIIYPPFPTNTIGNNWKEQGDPLFVDDGGPMDPSFKHDGTPPIDPFGPQPDFHLQANSPCRDAGGFLTTISSPAGSGNSFQVADAGYFMDGWGIEHIQGDLIQLAGQTQRSRITNVNYETNTITVGTPLAWTRNQGVSLDYEGSAPDLGAHEYAPLAVTSPFGGEVWIQSTNHNITWSASGVTEPVRIELFKGAVSQWNITTPIAHRSYAWAIPAEQATGSDYTIKLTAGAHESTSGNFSIAEPAAPIVTTNLAASIAQTSAILHGTVHPMGSGTTCYFEYGLDTSYGSTTPPVTLNADADTTALQATFTGMTAGTVYHFRLVAQNGMGKTEGAEQTFTTTSSGGGGGPSGSGGGGGGGGCFMAAVQGPNLWFMILGLMAVWTVMRARSFKKANIEYRTPNGEYRSRRRVRKGSRGRGTKGSRVKKETKKGNIEYRTPNANGAESQEKSNNEHRMENIEVGEEGIFNREGTRMNANKTISLLRFPSCDWQRRVYRRFNSYAPRLVISRNAMTRNRIYDSSREFGMTRKQKSIWRT